MDISIAYSKASSPSALALADELEEQGIQATAHRSDSLPVDINWGRRRANAKLNPDISNAVNKKEMRRLFTVNHVPTPTVYYPDLDIEDDGCIAGIAPWPVIGRPDYHARGKGFWLCHNRHDVLRALRGTRRKAAATHFMEVIEDVQNEYRVHIFRGKSLRISQKAFTGETVPGSPNHKLYTTVKPTGPLRRIRKVAKHAVDCLGLDFGAVDIIVDSDGEAYALEVNAAPGLGGSMPRVYAEAIKKWKEGE